MKLHKLILTVIAGSLLFVSCTDDDNQNIPSGAYDNGMLILNEGKFLGGNASVSFLSEAMTIENNVFSTVNNGAALGDTAQDMGFNGDLAYVVLNVSNKIEIVNRYTFVKVSTIDSGLINPRYIAFKNGNAYVTCWGDAGVATDDYIAIIDLTANIVSSTISVAEGPEKIVEENGKLYVAHAGGWNQGNIVSVINIANNNVVTTISVGTVPNSLEVENDNLYVMSGGMPSWTGSETPGQLDVISLNNNTVTKTVDFATGEHPSNLVIEDSKIFYTIDNDVYTMALTSATLPLQPLFSAEDQEVYNLYSFAVENGHIYVGNATDFSSDDEIFVYSLIGTLQNSFTVGIAPRGFYFND